MEECPTNGQQLHIEGELSQGEKVLMYSYGSGAMGTLFGLRCVRADADVPAAVCTDLNSMITGQTAVNPSAWQEQNWKGSEKKSPGFKIATRDEGKVRTYALQ